MTIGDVIRDGKLLEVHYGDCRPARHLYIDAGSLDLPRRLSAPQIADHLVCNVCGAKNSETIIRYGRGQMGPSRWRRTLSGLWEGLNASW